MFPNLGLIWKNKNKLVLMPCLKRPPRWPKVPQNILIFIFLLEGVHCILAAHAMGVGQHPGLFCTGWGLYCFKRRPPPAAMPCAWAAFSPPLSALCARPPREVPVYPVYPPKPLVASGLVAATAPPPCTTTCAFGSMPNNWHRGHGMPGHPALPGLAELHGLMCQHWFHVLFGMPLGGWPTQ